MASLPLGEVCVADWLPNHSGGAAFFSKKCGRLRFRIPQQAPLGISKTTIHFGSNLLWVLRFDKHFTASEVRAVRARVRCGVVSLRLLATWKSILTGVAELASATARFLHVRALRGARTQTLEAFTFSMVLAIEARRCGRTEKRNGVALAARGTRLRALGLHEPRISLTLPTPCPTEAILLEVRTWFLHLLPGNLAIRWRATWLFAAMTSVVVAEGAIESHHLCATQCVAVILFRRDAVIP
mmetsp:Transcript_55163/g.109555  ORF Transcript_55163/g.109555 Transcript_55163/m.109555 type:complete len:241 (+) Transcript_55163:321-1043(+)